MSRRVINRQRYLERQEREAAEAPWLRAKRAVANPDVLLTIEDCGDLGYRAFYAKGTPECFLAVGGSIPAALKKLAAMWPTSAPEALRKGCEPKKTATAKAKDAA